MISSKDKNIDQDDMVSINQIIDKLSKKIKKGSIFLKLDIEGSEWEIIDDMANAVDLLSGIAIEVHELEINGNKLNKLIQKFEEVGLYWCMCIQIIMVAFVPIANYLNF